MPQTSADVPDDLDARLVVLGIGQPYAKTPDSAAEIAAKAILETRGNSPRLYRNTLVFLAADKTRLQDLDEAARTLVDSQASGLLVKPDVAALQMDAERPTAPEPGRTDPLLALAGAAERNGHVGATRGPTGNAKGARLLA